MINKNEEVKNATEKKEAITYNKCLEFVNYIISEIKKDNEMRVNLIRPESVYMGYKYIFKFFKDIQNPIPFLLVASLIAQARPSKNGEKNLGEVLYITDCSNLELAEKRLYGILNRPNIVELCHFIPYIFKYLISKGTASHLDFAKLLMDIFYFGEKTKERWAQGFFKNYKYW